MSAEPVDLPTRRTHIFDPPAELAEVRPQQPVCPLRLPDGTAGWLVTGHAETRQVLTDPRFSARQEVRRMPPGAPSPPPATPGFFVRMDPPDHTRYRRLVAAHFSRRRLRDLVPVITAITDRQLDAIEAHGPPADLVELFGMPIPALVVGEILGVADVDRDQFQADSQTAVDLRASPAEVADAIGSITRLLGDLVARKRRDPGPDLLSALLAEGDLTAEEVTAMGFLLLVAGHETTANMATLAVFALLCHPGRLAEFRAVLAAEPDHGLGEDGSGAAGRAVDELLRYATINQFGAMRVPLVDVELAGQRLQAGDSVILSLPAANRDPRCYAEPDRLRLDRAETGHLSFGHGAHLCTGHQLARLELRIMLARLFTRFEHLRLAVTPQQVPLRTEMSIYGVCRLPVTW